MDIINKQLIFPNTQHLNNQTQIKTQPNIIKLSVSTQKYLILTKQLFTIKSLSIIDNQQKQMQNSQYNTFMWSTVGNASHLLPQYKLYFKQILFSIQQLKKCRCKAWSQSQKQSYQLFLSDIRQYIDKYIWTGIVEFFDEFIYALDQYSQKTNKVGRQIYDEILLYFKTKYDINFTTFDQQDNQQQKLRERCSQYESNIGSANQFNQFSIWHYNSYCQKQNKIILPSYKCYFQRQLNSIDQVEKNKFIIKQLRQLQAKTSFQGYTKMWRRLITTSVYIEKKHQSVKDFQFQMKQYWSKNSSKDHQNAQYILKRIKLQGANIYKNQNEQIIIDRKDYEQVKKSSHQGKKYKMLNQQNPQCKVEHKKNKDQSQKKEKLKHQKRQEQAQIDLKAQIAPEKTGNFKSFDQMVRQIQNSVLNKIRQEQKLDKSKK